LKNISFLPIGNIYFGGYFGTFGSFSEGYTSFLKPIPVGAHKLNYDVAVTNPVERENNYQQNATYSLIVK
jgi:hypothetical protein